MIPDLGAYAAAVLAAYGVSLALLFGLLIVTLRRGQAARRALKEVESRRSSDA